MANAISQMSGPGPTSAPATSTPVAAPANGAPATAPEASSASNRDDSGRFRKPEGSTESAVTEPTVAATTTPEATETPESDDLGEPYTPEEVEVLKGLLKEFHEKGGKPAAISAPEAAAAVEAPAVAPAAPAAPQQANDGVIPQYRAEIPQDVVDAFETGDPTPYFAYQQQNLAAQHMGFVNNLNHYIKNDIVPMIGNMVETAVITARIQHENELYADIGDDVMREVMEYRASNPSTSLAKATKEVVANLKKNQVTASAIAKLAKRGFDFSGDLRKAGAPAAPRTNARTNPAPANQNANTPSIAKAIALMTGTPQ
jgi:hypothetical protein